MNFPDVMPELKRSLAEITDIYIVRWSLPLEIEERNNYDNSHQWARIYGKVERLASDVTYQVSQILGLVYVDSCGVVDVSKYDDPQELADDLKKKLEEA